MNDLMRSLEQIGLLINFIALIYGCCTCFFGYKIFRLQVAILGFCTGGVIGYILGLFMADSKGMATVCALILGLLGAWLAYTFYMLSVFLSSFALSSIILCIFNEGDITAVCIVGGLIVGVISLFFVKPIIIITTGLGGGASVALTVAQLIDMGKFVIVLGLAMGAAGIYFQFKSGGESGNIPAEPGEQAQKGAGLEELKNKAVAVGSGVKQAATTAYHSDTAVQLREKAKTASASALDSVQNRTANRFCPKCGKTVAGSSSFCSGCGNKLG